MHRLPNQEGQISISAPPDRPTELRAAQALIVCECQEWSRRALCDCSEQLIENLTSTSLPAGPPIRRGAIAASRDRHDTPSAGMVSATRRWPISAHPAKSRARPARPGQWMRRRPEARRRMGKATPSTGHGSEFGPPNSPPATPMTDRADSYRIPTRVLQDSY